MVKDDAEHFPAGERIKEHHEFSDALGNAALHGVVVAESSSHVLPCKSANNRLRNAFESTSTSDGCLSTNLRSSKSTNIGYRDAISRSR
jgi:hypothetical protein